jgi:hypothetical protein
MMAIILVGKKSKPNVCIEVQAMCLQINWSVNEAAVRPAKVLSLPIRSGL